jgi:hypothetical protein
MLHVLAAAALLAAGVDSDQLPDDFVPTVRQHAPGLSSNGDGGGVLGHQANGSVLGVDSLVNFSSYFYEPGAVPFAGGDGAQFTWPYTMVGRQPFGRGDSDGTTVITADIIPVSLDLRNFDGSPRFFVLPDGTKVRMFLDATPLVAPVLASPIFQNARYGSSERPTQYNDAIHRAQFFRQADDDWHTLLRPSVKAARTLVLIRGTYRFSVDATGHLRYVLVDSGVFGASLFPPTIDDTSTIMGAAEHAGDMSTRNITTLLFNNTYLFDGATGDCCILGYHAYDLEPGDASNGWRERRYVMNYSSWISPGIFSGNSFVDITALSHELAELFSDPFVNNATPIWVAPNGLCQNNLEAGDVIEGLPNSTFPITMNGMTYHPQNEALLQWFAGQSPSSAYRGAYSYPDTTVLTSPAVSVFSDCATPVSFSNAK